MAKRKRTGRKRSSTGRFVKSKRSGRRRGVRRLF